MLRRSKLPLSLLIEPYPSKHAPVPLVSHGSITRCRSCKSFINPFIQFIDNGIKWKCNLCNFDDNQVPPGYDWDHITRQKTDRWCMPELNYGCVDYLATSEFLARPPQPPIYVFVLDISASALGTAMIKVFAESLIECIDNIPNNDERTRVGFITASQSVGFCCLANNSYPEWLMVSEIDDIYLPRMSCDLVVNLTEAKTVVMDLLERLKVMFSPYSSDNNNCLGSALKAARLLLVSYYVVVIDILT
jgi:protein transport protein SEC24